MNIGNKKMNKNNQFIKYKIQMENKNHMDLKQINNNEFYKILDMNNKDMCKEMIYRNFYKRNKILWIKEQNQFNYGIENLLY